MVKNSATKNLLVLAGPTATGKSSMAITLSDLFSFPIVNFDSLLFYRELEIGVAKPSVPERTLYPHYLIDVASIANPINAADFKKMAEPLLEKLWENHDTIILVGGSGFYLQALIFGMTKSLSTPADIKNKSEQLYQAEGISPFIEVLKLHDPAILTKLHPHDHYRIRRATEHWWSTGTPFSLAQAQQAFTKLNSPYWQECGWNLATFYLDLPKDEHLQLILQRTQFMLRTGLVEEVRTLLKNFPGTLKPLQSIGYLETQLFLNGTIPNMSELENKIVISTRQLAKAQRTWFAKIKKQTFHPIQQKNNLIHEVAKFCNLAFSSKV